MSNKTKKSVLRSGLAPPPRAIGPEHLVDMSNPVWWISVPNSVQSVQRGEGSHSQREILILRVFSTLLILYYTTLYCTVGGA